jgi:hypothetical protein
VSLCPYTLLGYSASQGEYPIILFVIWDTPTLGRGDRRERGGRRNEGERGRGGGREKERGGDRRTKLPR